MNEFARYIGQPWEAGGVGPYCWDCMSFAAHIQREHFGIGMPNVAVPDYDDNRSLVAFHAACPERLNWLKIQRPEHGALVLVRSPMHYGVWLNIDGGGVLHCVRGQGVVWTKDAAWGVSGFGKKVYLRHKSK